MLVDRVPGDAQEPRYLRRTPPVGQVPDDQDSSRRQWSLATGRRNHVQASDRISHLRHWRRLQFGRSSGLEGRQVSLPQQQPATLQLDLEQLGLPARL